MSDKNISIKPISAAVGVALVTSLAVSSTAKAADNPFVAADLSDGYLLAGHDGDSEEGKCGEGKCGEGKKAEEGSCGEKKAEEGSCGEKKAEEGSCGEKKGEEGSCGEKKAEEGSCGGDKA